MKSKAGLSMAVVAAFLAGTSAILAAGPSVQNPGFEDGDKGWTAKAGFQASAKIGPGETVHGGKQSAHLSAAQSSGAASVEQNVGKAETGLYEFTVWASGRGRLQMIVKNIASRKFTVAENGWNQYSLIFELPEPTECTVALEVTGDAFLDDISLMPADADRIEAWKKQTKMMEQFAFIPSGYSAQRPEPAAKQRDAAAAAKQLTAITDKIVFYDPKYDSAWVTNADKIAEWFSARGFEVKSALATAEWMKTRIENGNAYGSVAVMSMGLVPGVLVGPEAESSLLRKYLEAGGRVTWMGDTSLYVIQDETGSCHCNAELMPRILDVSCDSAKWLNVEPQITAAGKAWGLASKGSCIRGVRKEEVTQSLSENSAEGCSAVWLKTLNPDYPLSGFIASVHSVDGKNEGTFCYFYSLALFAGKPVEIPKAKEGIQEKEALKLRLVIAGGETERRAFVRGETAAVKAVLEGSATAKQIDVELKLIPGAPPMKTYDMAKLEVEPYKHELIEFRKSSSGDQYVFSKTVSISPAPGMPAASEAVAVDTKDLAVGSYELRVVVTSDSAGHAEAYEPLAICGKPRFDRVLRYIRGGNPTNKYRLYGYVEDIVGSALDAGVSDPGQTLPDLMLIEGKTFMASLETCHCLVENRIAPDGKEFPNPWGGGRPGLPALAGEKAVSNVFKYSFDTAKKLAAYPAFARVFEANDDWSARGGWDYNKCNLEAFKAKTGLDAPVPEEFKRAKLPTEVHSISRPPGIIDDKDPWLIWNTFLCRDVFGGLNDAQRRAVTEAAPGSLIWMVPGGAQWPLFSVASGLYPPYNFGSEYGMNAIGYYTYYDYWTPTLKYLYASEMGRMANRDLQSWVMPDAGGDARHYIRNMTHLLLAAGVHGLNYFAHDPTYFGKEGRIEHAELGRMLDAHGPLLYRLVHAPKRVGLLVPFSEAIFDTSYGQSAAAIFCDMAMAHIDVEPVAEEELDQCRHKVIALWRIKHLKKSSVDSLERYIQKGGVVLMDKDCEVPIKGARKLDISFGAPSNETYGKPEGIRLLKDIFAFLGAPEFDSPEQTTVVRSFVSPDGVKYVYAVQVDSYDEYQFWWKNIYLANLFKRPPKLSPEEMETFKRRHGMGAYVNETAMTVDFDAKLLPEGGQAVDVFREEALDASDSGNGRKSVTVTTRKFGGTLIALLPASIDHVSIKGSVNGQERTAESAWWDIFGSAAFEVRRGETVDLYIQVCGKDGKQLPGLHSMEFKLIRPDGSTEKEIYPNQAAEKGTCKISFTPARNHPDGTWTLHARELFTGKNCKLRFKLTE